MKVVPYVSFNGNCEEAIRFYHSVLGGELQILRFKDLPIEENISISHNWKEKIMHASLNLANGSSIYFGDSWEELPLDFGTNYTVHIQVDSEEDVYNFYNKLSIDGSISMPSGKTFWNSIYGSFVDKYGISWGIEFELKE